VQLAAGQAAVSHLGNREIAGGETIQNVEREVCEHYTSNALKMMMIRIEQILRAGLIWRRFFIIINKVVIGFYKITKAV